MSSALRQRSGSASNIVELRQYTLKPGQRDVLIALFEHEFVESQEETGMTLIGTFRDADNPNRFVWLRGFPDMDSRAQSLAAFYGGPVWKAHREAANATMIDSGNVLLLRPAWDGAGFAERALPPRDATVLPNGLVVASICYFDATVPEHFIRAFRETDGAKAAAALVTEESTNNFPALPVREDEHVFVWFSVLADIASAPITLSSELERCVAKPVELLRLHPSARSRLHS